MLAKFSGIGIKSISVCLPAYNPTVLECGQGFLSEKQAKRFTLNTGFARLCMADKQHTTADLCIKAAQKILQKDNRANVNALVFVTTTSNWPTPATSHYIRHILGLPEQCICIDVNEACSGYVMGYYLACSLIKGGQCRNVLLLCGDTASRYTDPKDSATHLLFGEAGSATLVGAMDNIENYFANATYGERYNALIAQYSAYNLPEGYLTMDGVRIMDFSLNEVPETISRLLEYAKTDKEKVNLFACHQANKLILESLAKKLAVPPERVPFMAARTGNLMSASIPAMLSIYDKSKQKNIVLAGFGAGLACAFCLTDLSNTEIMEIEYL